MEPTAYPGLEFPAYYDLNGKPAVIQHGRTLPRDWADVMIDDASGIEIGSAADSLRISFPASWLRRTVDDMVAAAFDRFPFERRYELSGVPL